MAGSGSDALLKNKATKKTTKTTKKVVSEDAIVSQSNQIENLSREQAYELIPVYTNAVDESYFKLGGVLSVIQSNEWYKDDGYESFKEFIESKFGLHYRKAMYLIGIYDAIVEAGIAYDKFSGIGWTKIKEIASIVTLENVDEWVEKAKTLTVLQLQDAVKKASQGTLSSSDEKPASGPTTYSVKVHPDQKETIEQAVDKALKEAGTEFKGVALEAICMNYLAGGKQMSEKGKEKSLKQFLKAFPLEDVLQVIGDMYPDVDISVKM